ncbi:uncharacterized protein LOC142818439 [Pelodiscus sinensis]|uniref:uncharacterized protein LOC142818439 n=1 Tax=Pelodiscus sinensis TaxID=13735 RepID=UPI003F6AE30F
MANPFYEIIWMYNNSRNTSDRILQFRMTRPNTSAPVSVAAGHFRARLEFEKNISSLSIPAASMNDSGLYYCDVVIGPPPVHSRTDGIHLIVVKATENVQLISWLAGGFFLAFLLALGVCFTLKRRSKAQKPEVSLELYDLVSSPPVLARGDTSLQPSGHEMIYSKLQWSKYSMASSPETSARSGEPETRNQLCAGTGNPTPDAVYAVLQAR